MSGDLAGGTQCAIMVRRNPVIGLLFVGVVGGPFRNIAQSEHRFHYLLSFPVATVVGPIQCWPCNLVGNPVQLLHGLGIGQQLAAHGIHCANEDHRDIQMLDEMMDHLMEVTVSGGQQQRTPLPVPVRPHQMEGQADINDLLLDMHKLQAIAGVHDWVHYPKLSASSVHASATSTA